MIRRLVPWLLVAVLASAHAEDAQPAAAATVRTVRIAGGLESPRDIAITPDDDTRVYVAELGGFVRVIQANVLQDEPVFDMEELTVPASGFGLESIALPRDFATSKTLFFSYTDKQGDSVLASVPLSGDNEPAVADDMTVLLKVIQPTPKHPPMKIRFGSDGYLYVIVPAEKPQLGPTQADSFLGSVARLDVSDPKKYTVPSDNPPLGTSKAPHEIWARGIGNPWAFFLDHTSKQLILGLSSSPTTLEIAPVKAKGFYGVCKETWCKPLVVKPIITATKQPGQRLIGGATYRVESPAELKDSFIAAERHSGTLIAISQKPGARSSSTVASVAPDAVEAIADSGNGEIYFATTRGNLLKLVP